MNQTDPSNPVQSLRQQIRLVKNDLIKNYQNIRVNTPQNPYQIWLRKKPCRILLLLGHMRSGSSLLTHILVSNPDVIGYGETHIKYGSDLDFKKLILKVYWQSQEFRKFQDLKNLRMNHQYILDKVLHNTKILDETILTSENIYTIFLIREPARSFASMLDHKPHWQEQDALDYYLKRLAKLEAYAKLINNKQRSLILSHQQLIDQTELVF